MRPPGTTDLDAEGLVQRFSDLARRLQRQEDSHGTLVEIVRSAVHLVPGCDGGSISLVRRRHVVPEAASGELAALVDELQERTGEGPCLDAMSEHETVRVPDMTAEQRWPQFAAAAQAAGVGSMLCFQLYVHEDNLGALNLYSRTAQAFDDEAVHVGELFASHAAIAYAAARTQEGLARSVSTRQLIGQAQGILMERHKVSADAAFGLLVRVSQHTNHKLREVAERFVRTGELPRQPQPE